MRTSEIIGYLKSEEYDACCGWINTPMRCMKGRNYMEKLLETLIKNKCLCEIYTDDDLSTFCVGKIVCCDDVSLISQCFNKYGEYDGYAIFYKDDIVKIARDTEYLKCISYFIGDSAAVEEFEPKGLMIYTINALIQNKSFALISFCGEKICGVINSLHGNMISVTEYNEYGFCDGTSTLNLDNITCIEFDSRETKRVQALADMRAAGRE